MKNITLAAAPLLAATVATGALAQTLPTEKYPFVSGPITITSCSVNENKSDSTVSPNSLRINYYVNAPNRRITSVTFRVRYAQTPVTVTDTGAFDYKNQISHQFNLLGGLPWTGPDPTVCRVLTASFDDGKTVNPPYAGADPEEAGAAAPAAAPAPPAAPAPAVAPAPPAPPAPAPAAT
jgi:hypothetical protein